MSGIILIAMMIGCVAVGWLLGSTWQGSRDWIDGYQDGYRDREDEYYAIMQQIRLQQAKRQERKR